MEVAMPGPLALDCEDMFKEITKKLYGEEGALDFPDRVDHEEGSMLKPEDHITAFGLAALMQNGFPPPGILHANFQPKTNPAAEDKWTPSDEALQWTASRIASYNPAQKLFKCVDCECVGFLSRIAEHWLGTHSNARVFQCPQCAYGSAWARCVRLHLVREHNMPDDRGTDTLVKNNPVLDEVTKYLQRLKVKVDSMSPPPAPAAVGRAPSGSPPAGPPGPPAVPGAAKRYGCPACPYATDRRDLFTRHENIHRDEKPFECYVCQKQFNRADHVKKHFLRMHRDHPYDLNRIRRQIPKTSPGQYYPKVNTEMAPQQQQNQGEQSYVPRVQHVKTEHNMQHQVKAEHDGNTKHAGSKKKGDKRYSCCYCPWSGVDNWCLKRHLNTHLKPFVCALCDYKAARSERLSTHVSKVHNKKACGKCSFLAEDQAQLALHMQEQHHVENRSIKVPNTMVRAGYSGAPVTPVMPAFGPSSDGSSLEPVRAPWRPPRQQGAARLFNYMEASDGSDQDDFSGGRGHPGYPHAQERNVQDFPKAGDVGNSAADAGERDSTAAHGATVTSPAEIPKHSTERKKKLPKTKKSHNKENKKSAFVCNVCSLSFKTAGLLTTHQKRHVSSSTLRSPLLAANGASPQFQFDNALNPALETSESSPQAWESDEERQLNRRSRKQSQPKKVILLDGVEDISLIVPDESNQENTSVECRSVQIKHKTHNPSENPVKHIDTIISKIRKDSTQKIDLCDSSSQCSSNADLYNLPRIVADLKCRKINMRKKRNSRNRNRDIITKMLLKKLRNKTPYIIFRCKRCRLKFNNKYEIYLHNNYCKKKRYK